MASSYYLAHCIIIMPILKDAEPQGPEIAAVLWDIVG
jgi:hypothetical protein